MLKEISPKHRAVSYIQKELKPLVRSIDMKHYYPASFLKGLGERGFFSSGDLSYEDVFLRESQLVEDVSRVCMTTGFLVWCHLAALTYARHTTNEHIRKELLPRLESGEILGATGLSNPMKFYGKLEKLHLHAERVAEGYVVSGCLPAVSNVQKNGEHYFGFVAHTDTGNRIMAFAPCNSTGLTMKEKRDYLGLNGSATFVCQFEAVFIPDQYVISEDADAFVSRIRPFFLLYQIPIGLGVVRATIESIHRAKKKQTGVNAYLPVQAEDIEQQYNKTKASFQTFLQSSELDWKGIAKTKLETAYLTLQGTQTEMLHNGGAAYLMKSDPSRRLREAYFYANLTPTIKHLEKITH
ncbi:acyl-CoA dehydrogenase family protein [Aliibacillus thermotolerans]|uniref:Acyl-CoA dehydrogenase family protein n=1 Tax=Aliibacillus thermotolerans TaxID=1834418 RepID=A0ABW0U5P2_9BACI|nr:acyl-CoA dehydrogenase family protein [Aliibacillus thermotolerans]MDA3129005.1 acyl-CoA dehydrogenase [Aliibacillus thermotolerans]